MAACRSLSTEQSRRRWLRRVSKRRATATKQLGRRRCAVCGWVWNNRRLRLALGEEIVEGVERVVLMVKCPEATALRAVGKRVTGGVPGVPRRVLTRRGRIDGSRCALTPSSEARVIDAARRLLRCRVVGGIPGRFAGDGVPRYWTLRSCLLVQGLLRAGLLRHRRRLLQHGAAAAGSIAPKELGRSRRGARRLTAAEEL